MFNRCQLWQAHVKPGCWPDCDMLPLGRIGEGFKKPRFTNFTQEEQRTLMTLWCVFRSPLMMGGILPGIDEETLSLLTNEEVLAVQRFGAEPKQIAFNDNEAVWMNNASDGNINLALFNLSDETREVSCKLSELGFKEASLRDLWNKKDIGNIQDKILEKIAPHRSSLYKVSRVL